MHDLTSLGWRDDLAAALRDLDDGRLRPARVVAEDRGLVQLADPDGVRPGRPTGRLLHQATSRLELPAVGDWVAVDPEGRVVALLPRKGAFVRRAAGTRSEPQVLAANVDVALLVSGLDHDFNARRIERWVTAAWDAGAEPVLVLNKAERCPDPSRLVARLGSLASLLSRVTMSALHGDGLEALDPWLAPGRTLALLGSSGVGKSTLANRLLGEERQATREVRDDDSRGRHCTVRRELLLLPAGRGLLLDTPGLRELQLWWADSEGPAAAYPDIDELAAGCAYRDCRHEDEPGCAVLDAVEVGQLHRGRLIGWRKLIAEQASEARRQDARLRRREGKRWGTLKREVAADRRRRGRD